MAYNRRLPVYLLLDCSESMAGEVIDEVGKGVQMFVDALKGDPMALETGAISVIAFATRATQVVPLTDLFQFQALPRLVLGSGTALGAALELWLHCMDREVVRTTADLRGDYKPLAVLMTDGEPTDAWEAVADKVKLQVVGRQASLIALACGPDADPEKLRRITDTVVVASETSPEKLRSFFQWTSASVTMTSRSIAATGDGALALPALPGSLQRPEAGAERPVRGDDRFVFLHARCATRRSFYLLKFGRVEGSPAIYRGIASYPLDDFDGGGDAVLKVSNTQLQSPPGCPYCENKIWAMCRKGHVHCCPTLVGAISLTCPWCNVTETYSGAVFDVGRGAG